MDKTFNLAITDYGFEPGNSLCAATACCSLTGWPVQRIAYLSSGMRELVDYPIIPIVSYARTTLPRVGHLTASWQEIACQFYLIVKVRLSAL
jgi:hypothetical protein